MPECTNRLECCLPNQFEYSSRTPDEPETPVEVETCPVCTADIPGNCVIEPPDIPDLDSWYAAYAEVFADVGGTTPCTDGQVARRWNDQSAFAFDLLGGIINPGMTFHTDVQNSLPVLRSYAIMDGSVVDTGGRLLNLGLTLLNQETIVMAFRFRTDPLWPDDRKRSAIIYAGDPSGTLTVTRNGDGSLFLGKTDSAGNIVIGFSGGSVAMNEFIIVSIVVDAANSFFRINNGPKITGDIGSLNAIGFTVGGIATSDTADDDKKIIGICDYCEFAKFSRIVSDVDIFGVTNYLSQKWDIPIA